MDRLSLPRRPKIVEKEKCLPAGDGLPSWSTLPLDAKFPLVPNPKGSMVFCSTNLCETKHKSSRHYDFDLSDPYCHVFSNDYHPLHDRHLRNHFNQPQMRRHLLKNDFLTDDNKVVCTLKEFNRYRQYLRRVCLMELAREQRIEKEKLLNAQKETMDSTKEKPTDVRIRQVQENLERQRTTTRKRIEQLLQEKANRLRGRLRDISEANAKRELLRQQDESKRQAALEQHHLEQEKRNRRLMKRWKLRERQHSQRLEEKKKQRVFDHNKKTHEVWQTRKQIQRERIEREVEILRRENERRDRNISVRERLLAEQRNRISAHLNAMKETMRAQKAEREKKYARRLEKKFALAELRAWARHQGKGRRGRRARFRSMWNLGETMERLIFDSDDYQDRTSASNFLHMLNDAVDDLHVSPEDVREDDSLIREQARQIVESVITKVCTELYPEYLRSLDQESQDGLQKSEKTVKFGCERIITTHPRGSVDTSALRPVEEHVLTPVASMNIMSPSLAGEESSDHVIVSKILNRLLTDLNDKKLSQEDLVKLTSYSLQILSSRESQSPKDDDLSELETGGVYETAVADDLVHFTISKIVDEVKSGQVSREELTGLALSAWDLDTQLSTEDGVVDTLIEDTIQHIISDKSFDRESSVHDFMLDEFIVKTLNEVSDDLKSGNLPMGVISQILQQMSDVVGDVPLSDAENKTDMFRSLLARVTDDVVSECSDTLYKVVNIIITSYHTYREASTQGLSELVADVCGRISTYLGSGEAHDSDVNFEAMCSIAIKICPTTISSQKVCELTSNIANILHIQTNAQNVDVDHIIDLSKSRLIGVGVETLIRIAHVILESCQDICDNLQVEEERTEGEQKQFFLEDVSQFVVDILKLVSRSVDRGSFSESDIQEMSELLLNVSRGNSLAPTPLPDKKTVLTNTLASILDDVENGRLTEAEMHELGNHLRSCGERLLGPLTSASRETTTRAASFTSTAVADNVVSHVLSSIQSDIDNDLMNTESLKELAVCILKTRMSKDKLDTDSNEDLIQAVNSSHTHPSPCESRLAEDVVFATIDNIVKDLNEGKLYPDKITSLASTAISSVTIGFSKTGDPERMDHAMNKILDCLREDTIDREEAKRMFITILDHYKSNWSTMPQSRDVSALSSTSQLAESLIRATLNKINRDIQSGAYTEAELLSLMGSKCEMEGPAVADDVVNLISATIQEILRCIESGTISIEDLSNFLSLFVSQKQTKPEDITMEIAHKKCKEAARDIVRHGGRSVYIKDIVKFIANSKHDSKSGPVAVLQSLLKIVDSNILTNFIRVTLQRVLVDIGSASRKGQLQEETSLCIRSDVHLQSATSLIAHNVVRNLMARIDHTLVVQGKLSSDEELLPVRLDSHDFDYIQSLYDTEPDMYMSYSSNEIGCLILDTLNNIVSNLRLERSMSGEQDAKHVSSDVLHDFVLEKLQGIVENMQDQMALGNEWLPSELADIDSRDSRSKVVSFLDMNDKQATNFVTRVLQDVVHDMTEELTTATHQQTSNVDEQTSTLTLEVENIVVAALQDIVDDFTDAERECSHKIQQEIAKRKALDALVQIKRDVMEGNDAFIKDTVLRIMKSWVKPGPNELENEFIENTMNSVISNIEVDNIKTSDLYQEDSFTELSVGMGVVSPGPSEAIDGRLDRPSVSLQKMVDMTNRMLKFHEENKSRDQGTLLGVSSCGIPKLDRSSTLLNIASALTHSINMTIDNVKEGKLCDEEIVTLATALSQSMLDGGAEHVLSTASVNDSIEDFILVMLAEKKREIEQNGLDSKSIMNIADRIAGIQVKEKDGTQKSESVSSVSSEKIAGFVHTILQNIASSLTQLNTGNDNPTGDAVDDLEKSESAVTQHSGTGSISKQNINPNAVLPGINKRASSSHIIPTKMDCFTEVGNTKVPVSSKRAQLGKISQEQCSLKQLGSAGKTNSKSESTKPKCKQVDHVTSSRRTTGCQTSATGRKEVPQTCMPPKNRRPPNTSCHSSQATPSSKGERQAAHPKVFSLKTNHPSKKTLPVLDKLSQQNPPSAGKGKTSREDRKLEHNFVKGNVRECMKSSKRAPVIQTPAKEQKIEVNSRSNKKKKDYAASNNKLGQNTELECKKRGKSSTFEELFDVKPEPLNLVPYEPPVDKKTIPLEVQSICGSHRTKIRVIKDNSDIY